MSIRKKETPRRTARHKLTCPDTLNWSQIGFVAVVGAVLRTYTPATANIRRNDEMVHTNRWPSATVQRDPVHACLQCANHHQIVRSTHCTAIISNRPAVCIWFLYSIVLRYCLLYQPGSADSSQPKAFWRNDYTYGLQPVSTDSTSTQTGTS